MKLYTHVTDSHRAMFEQWLKPGAEREFEVCVGTSPQYGGGHWDDSGWIKNTHNKAKTMLRAVEDNPGDVVVWSDCDVQILKPIRERLLELLCDHDIAVGRNDTRQGAQGACSGFYVVKCHAKTLSFFQQVYEADVYKPEQMGLTDQAAFCDLLPTLDYSILPPTEFWCNRFPLDLDKIRVHHANWIKGVDNKVAALSDIRKKYNAQCYKKWGTQCQE